MPSDPNWESYPAGMYEFYRRPREEPAQTPSGKLEFESVDLKKHFPDDKERPPVPHWVEKSELHDERIAGKRAEDYPLLCMCNHPGTGCMRRWTTSAGTDEIVTCKVKGPDGYLYEPLWLHPSEAAKRGIKDGDICKVFNERGTVLVGARVWERIMPGVAYVDHGARADFIVPGRARQGRGHQHHHRRTASPPRTARAWSAAASWWRWPAVDLEALRKQYPEAFNRPYHEAAGLRSRECWWTRTC